MFAAFTELLASCDAREEAACSCARQEESLPAMPEGPDGAPGTPDVQLSNADAALLNALATLAYSSGLNLMNAESDIFKPPP